MRLTTSIRSQVSTSANGLRQYQPGPSSPGPSGRLLSKLHVQGYSYLPGTILSLAPEEIARLVSTHGILHSC
jgi:hypothetical protein